MPFRRFIPIALFLIAIIFPSCANRQTADTLNDVETYIQDHPDSALATIRAIDTATLTARSIRAHYALLHAHTTPGSVAQTRTRTG